MRTHHHTPRRGVFILMRHVWDLSEALGSGRWSSWCSAHQLTMKSFIIGHPLFFCSSTHLDSPVPTFQRLLECFEELGSITTPSPPPSQALTATNTLSRLHTRGSKREIIFKRYHSTHALHDLRRRQRLLISTGAKSSGNPAGSNPKT